jgi:hypothetical protein
MRAAQVAVVQVAQEQVILLQMGEVKTAVQVQLHHYQELQ